MPMHVIELCRIVTSTDIKFTAAGKPISKAEYNRLTNASLLTDCLSQHHEGDTTHYYKTVRVED